MKNFDRTQSRFESVFFVQGIFRFWLGLAFIAALLSIGGNAYAQCAAVTDSTTVSGNNYGSGQTYTVTLGNAPLGTCWDVTYTVTNSTAYPLRFILVNPAIAIMPSSPHLVVEPGYSVPSDITLQPGQFFTITFQIGVPATGTAVTNAFAHIAYSVGRVYDQVWNYGDFDYICGDLGLPSPTVVPASSPQVIGNFDNITPGCAYMQEATFVNDLSSPVTVYFTGYSDSGSIAPYVSGALCDMMYCGNEWVDGITLQPGESSAPFTMLLGSPWFIGNEMLNTTGAFEFDWRVTTGAPVPTQPAAPVPALNELALVLLVLGLAGLGARRAKRRRRA